MAHCININSPEYKSLVEQTTLGQRELKARIAAWQEINNTDSFPSIDQVEGLLDVPITGGNLFSHDQYLADNFPNIDSISLKTSINNIRINNKADELYSLGIDSNTLMNSSPSQRNFINAFTNVFSSITTKVEKSYLFNLIADENSNFFEKMAQMYDDFLTYTKEYNNFDKVTEKVFNRMYDLRNAILDKGSLLKSYIVQSSTPKTNLYKSDLRAYNEFKRRIPITHSNKSQRQINNAINRAVETLRKNFSNKVNIKVSQPKNTRNGDVSFVYVEKPNIKNYESQPSGTTLESLNKKDIDYLEGNRKKWFGDNNTTTIGEILPKFKGKLAHNMLKFIPDSVKNSTITYTEDIVIKNDNTFTTDIEEAEALYHPDGTISLAFVGLTERAILHEVSHAVTDTIFKNDPNNPLVTKIKDIYKEVKKELKGEEWYGIKADRVEEFAAEVWSNVSFKDRLKEIRDPNNKNLFQKFIDAICEFFGLSYRTKGKKSLLYDEAFSTISGIIKENFDYINNQDSYYKSLGDSIQVEDLKKLNNTFKSSPSSVRINNSPYTAALKRLNAQYNIQDFKDLTSSITSEFSDLISYYQESNPELTRQEVINLITPARLFKEVKENFEDYEYNYQLDKVEQKYIDNVGKLIDNYEDLAMMATKEINFVEGLKFGINDLKTFKYDLKSETDDGISQSSDMNNEIEFHENSVHDGWMKNFKHSSVDGSLTNQLKRILRGINEVDKNGNPIINSVGLGRKLDLDIIKNDLLSNLQNVITSRDLLPSLGIMAKSKPWVTSIIEYLQEDNELLSQFYSVFKKDFTKHSIVSSAERSDGTIEFKTPVINQSNDLTLWIEDWRNTLENKIIFNKGYSVYNSDGTLNLKNIENNIVILQDLLKEWKSIVKQKDVNLRKDFISRKGITIKNQLNAIGIGLSGNEVKDLFQDSFTDVEKVQQLFGVSQSSFNIDTVLSKVLLTNTWAKNNIDREGINAYSLIQDNNSNYSTIARLVSDNLEELVEGSVHENGKSYYTYLQPSYLSKTVKQLKNIRNNNKEFQEFINKNFKQYAGTIYNPETNTFNISWLNDLTDKNTGKSKRDLFDHKVVLNFNKTDYDSLSSADYQNLLLVEYFSSPETAWYHVPILAEAPSAEFIKFDKITLNFKDNIADKLMDLFTYEYNRIKMVRARQEGIKNGTIKSIKNLDTRGEKFIFLDFLNDHLKEIDNYMSSDFEVSPQTAFNAVHNWIIENLDKKAERAIDYLNKLGLLEKTKNGKYKYLDSLNITNANMKDKLEEYFYNSYLATANIIQLTSTDLSYYNNVEDFQKRNKEIHAPGTMVNTQATYKGERVGKDEESYIILADNEENSTDLVYEAIKQVLDSNSVLSKVDKERILTAYSRDGGAHNISDAQAYRSLDSAKSVIAMSTGWNDKLEQSYQRLKEGKWDISDYDNIMQAFKPFVYTQTTVDSGVMMDPSDPTKGNYMIKVPTQHKNSEHILLPMMSKQFNSSKLKGIMQAMSENNIDVVMFESAVKVGLQGVLNINEMNDSKQIADYIKSFKDNNQVFKKISYEDYKIQQPIPEHLQDSSQLFGTQLRKLVISDIHPDSIFNVRGKSFNKGAITKLYNDLIIENTLQSYEGLVEEFGSVDKLQNIIEEELISNIRYSRDLLNAIQLDSNKKFVLPLFDPSQSGRVQQLLNSIWKSRVTKQKIKGGTAVQVSSFGLSDTLELKFKTVNGKPAIDYMEVYLPFWSENIPENWENNFIDPNTGVMSVDKMLKAGIIDEEFLEGVSYRIPTEDKYSMWNIKVKGFLPRNSGGNIIMPREVTTITGSDFDIDKMYLMLKEFNFNKETGKFTTLTPDLNKDVKDLSTKERNNLLIDIMRSILSNPDTAIKQLNPGNFDGPKMTARRLNILASGANYTWNQLKNLNLKQLDAISNKQQLDILDFTTQISLHKQNMTAAKLIGIVANHSTSHAVRQSTKIEVNPIEVLKKNKETGESRIVNYDRFRLNGRFLTSLHDILNPEGTAYISKNFASFLAASVDAVKDPVLSYFNLNTFTADSAMLLTGLGYNFDEIGLLLRQPIIEELVDHYDAGVKQGINKISAIKELLEKYRSILENDLNTPITGNLYEIDSNDFTSEKMAEMIYLNHKLRDLNFLEGDAKESFIRANYGDIQEFYKYQYQVLLNYEQILDTAQKLSDFIGASKADTGNGGAGPTIADTKFKMRKIDKHIKNSNPIVGKPVLANADIIDHINPTILKNTNNLRDTLRNSKLGFIQGFTTLGLQATEQTFSQYFPHYKEYFNYIFDKVEYKMLKSNKLSVDLMNNIYNEFFAYYMSQFSEFSREGSNEFIRDFPKQFLDMKNKNEELKDIQLIKNIQYINPGVEVPVAKLKFKSGGRLSSNVRDTMIMEWESLLYQPKYRQLAFDLFKYNYFVNGFGFGTTSFMHLAPTALKLEIPNFTENLYKLMSDDIGRPQVDWGRTAENAYEVSTVGDSRFSALNARFNSSTSLILGTDVSGMTIEEVYQKIIKKSAKGRPPATDSILYDSSLTSKTDREEFSYRNGYLPLWREWASQNRDLIQELTIKSRGKTLTDKFANTLVSQARALADIINENESLGNDNNRFSEDELDIFIDQYYRNHLGNRRLVSEALSIEESTFKDSNSSIKENFSINVNEKNNPDMFTQNGNLLPYIYKNIDGKDEFFKTLIEIFEDDNSIQITLQHTNPLGIRNNFLEYDFNNVGLVSNITSEDFAEINNRSEYMDNYQNVTMPQDSNNYEYFPESASIQEMPEELSSHFNNAFKFIAESNNNFKSFNTQRFESLTEEDIPSFTSKKESSSENMSLKEEAPSIDNMESLVKDVSIKKIIEYKNKCKN